VIIGQQCAVKSKVWCDELERLGGQYVEKVCSGGESFDPVRGTHAGLEQKRAYNIVGGTNYALNFTVLG